MNARPILRRLLETLIIAGLAGGLVSALAAWLGPIGIAPIWAALVAAGVAALAIILPAGIVDIRRDARIASAPDTYYDYGASVDKDESWRN